LAAARPRAGSLSVVGTGIRAVSQVTSEALARIEQADRLFYSVSDAVTTQWLHEINPHAESLNSLYREGAPRLAIYEGMVERVLAAVRDGHETCLALYGHPGVCARAGHDSVVIARAEGHLAVMLPGVSCEDCLFADLGVDPATHGMQSHEATVFLSRSMSFDARAGLILWQIGMLGDPDYRLRYQSTELLRLVEHLAPAYGASHRVVLYEIPNYGGGAPVVTQTLLAALPEAELTWATTLYVPPRP
jgi:hypothetical protein